jgi:hypothetical protein
VFQPLRRWELRMHNRSKIVARTCPTHRCRTPLGRDRSSVAPDHTTIYDHFDGSDSGNRMVRIMVTRQTITHRLAPGRAGYEQGLLGMIVIAEADPGYGPAGCRRRLTTRELVSVQPRISARGQLRRRARIWVRVGLGSAPGSVRVMLCARQCWAPTEHEDNGLFSQQNIRAVDAEPAQPERLSISAKDLGFGRCNEDTDPPGPRILSLSRD